MGIKGLLAHREAPHKHRLLDVQKKAHQHRQGDQTHKLMEEEMNDEKGKI